MINQTILVSVRADASKKNNVGENTEWSILDGQWFSNNYQILNCT